jgi:hypothetical protein
MPHLVVLQQHLEGEIRCLGLALMEKRRKTIEVSEADFESWCAVQVSVAFDLYSAIKDSFEQFWFVYLAHLDSRSVERDLVNSRVSGARWRCASGR